MLWKYVCCMCWVYKQGVCVPFVMKGGRLLAQWGRSEVVTILTISPSNHFAPMICFSSAEEKSGNLNFTPLLHAVESEITNKQTLSVPVLLSVFISVGIFSFICLSFYPFQMKMTLDSKNDHSTLQKWTRKWYWEARRLCEHICRGLVFGWMECACCKGSVVKFTGA